MIKHCMPIWKYTLLNLATTKSEYRNTQSFQAQITASNRHFRKQHLNPTLTHQ